MDKSRVLFDLGLQAGESEGLLQAATILQEVLEEERVSEEVYQFALEAFQRIGERARAVHTLAGYNGPDN